MATSAFAVEVITLPVNDVDRALQFYLDRIGFAFDVDWRPREDFGVVQLTPPGSGCSIQIGTGLTEATPGSVRNTSLVVNDLAATREALLGRGTPVSQIRHKTPAGAWDGGFARGLDPARGDYASSADFATPTATRGSSMSAASARPRSEADHGSGLAAGTPRTRIGRTSPHARSASRATAVRGATPAAHACPVRRHLDRGK